MLGMRPSVGCALLALLPTAHADIHRYVRCIAADEATCARQLGSQLGETLRSGVSLVAAPLLPYVNSAAGGSIFNQLLAVNKRVLPSICAELEGYAKGANVDTREAYVSAFATELRWFALHQGFNLSGAAPPKKCSDYHSLDQSGSLAAWVHNEDGALADINASYLIDANVTGGGSASSSSVPLRRVSFVYSHDLIGGWAWSLNSHGIGQSVNALDPTNLTIGVADAFHARYIAGATSLADAVQRACALKPLAGGQHFNLGSIHEPDHQLMIEASNVGCDVRVLRKPMAAATTVEPAAAPDLVLGGGAADDDTKHPAITILDEPTQPLTIGYHANVYTTSHTHTLSLVATAAALTHTPLPSP